MRDPKDKALETFAELASELEIGRGDPESFIAQHRVLEPGLRELYRGWQRVDGLLRQLASGSSLVQIALEALDEEASEERCREALSRIEASRSFAERYELGSELGHGGMGVVWRVRDRLLGRDLALKVVREHPGGDRTRARLLRRFLEEAQLTGRLQHPSIVAIHDLGLDAKGRIYFTMPLVEGLTLERVMELARTRREGWNLPRVLEVLLKGCDAIAFAHSRGVLHRDLKPTNVLVGSYGEVYVLDWGLALSVGAPDRRQDVEQEGRAKPAGLTLAGEVLGTPSYMAPEQALSKTVDERADAYSLGAILYECLCGRRPYASGAGERSSEETLELLRRGPPEDVARLSPGIPSELVAIVRKAMARHRDQRYADVPAMASDLRAYLEGRVVQAHEQGRLAEARKWLGRNRALAIASGFALLALAIGLFSQLRAARNAHEAARQSAIVERKDLLEALTQVRRPATSVEIALAFPVAGNEGPVEISPEAAQSVLEDHARYAAVLAAHDAADLSSLERLFDGASLEEAAAMLDELYWFELRLVPVSRVRERSDKAQIQAQLSALDGLVRRHEIRSWSLALREAWKRRLAGDVAAFDGFLTEARTREAGSEELEWLSVLLSSLGDERLRPVLVRVLELDPGSYWAHFRMATLSSGEERLLHAYAAAVLQPGAMEAWFNLGWNYHNIHEPPFNDPEVAKHYYRKALELEPSSWQAAINLSYLVSVEEGIELMERAIQAKPAGILYFRLAERLRSASRCDRAIEVARTGLELFPDEAGLWAILGECEPTLERALAPLERALELEPGSFSTRANLCCTLNGLADAEEDPARRQALAERGLAEALEASTRFPEEPVILEHLGTAYCNLERFEEGVPLLIQSLELGNSNAQSVLGQFKAVIATRPDLAALVKRIAELEVQ